EPVTGKPNGELPVGLLLDELVDAAVPDLDGARAVLAGRDLAGEGGVVERVILDVDGEGTRAGLERHALGHGPGSEDAVPLEAEVVVEPAGIVALDDEDRRLSAPAPAERLRCLVRIALAPVIVELCQSFSTGMRKV